MERRISHNDNDDDQGRMAKGEKRFSAPVVLRGRPSPAEIERLLREERRRRRKRRIASIFAPKRSTFLPALEKRESRPAEPQQQRGKTAERERGQESFVDAKEDQCRRF